MGFSWSNTVIFLLAWLGLLLLLLRKPRRAGHKPPACELCGHALETTAYATCPACGADLAVDGAVGTASQDRSGFWTDALLWTVVLVALAWPAYMLTARLTLPLDTFVGTFQAFHPRSESYTAMEVVATGDAVRKPWQSAGRAVPFDSAWITLRTIDGRDTSLYVDLERGEVYGTGAGEFPMPPRGNSSTGRFGSERALLPTWPFADAPSDGETLTLDDVLHFNKRSIFDPYVSLPDMVEPAVIPPLNEHTLLTWMERAGLNAESVLVRAEARELFAILAAARRGWLHAVQPVHFLRGQSNRWSSSSPPHWALPIACLVWLSIWLPGLLWIRKRRRRPVTAAP